MKADDIRDEESLRAWLESRPEPSRHHAAVTIALRSACRVMPIYEVVADPAKRQESCISVVALFRPAISFVHMSRRSASDDDSDPFGVCNEALRARDVVTDSTLNAAAAAAVGICVEARGQDTGAYENASWAAAVAAEHFAASEMSIWSAARADAALIASGQDPLAAPLWHGTTPDWFHDADLGMRAIWDAAPGIWVFWRRWWDGILSGNQIDRDLQEAVALIPNEVWQAGPDEVAQEIARIEERNDLRKRVSELERQLQDAIAIPAPPAPAGLRSHNNPPELVDPVAELRGELDRLLSRPVMNSPSPGQTGVSWPRSAGALLRQPATVLASSTGRWTLRPTKWARQL